MVLVGRNTHTLEAAGQRIGDEGTDWIAVAADISQTNDRCGLLETALRRFHRIDAIVNNAALGTCKPLGEMSGEEINQLFAVNAVGPVELVKEALPELIERGGCVVNIASMAIVDPFPGLGVYGCTKAAIDALTRCLHIEYGDQGVRAYTVSPGAVETRLLRTIVSEEDLPASHTLAPERVAAQIVACVVGACDEPSGSTIVMVSP